MAASEQESARLHIKSEQGCIRSESQISELDHRSPCSAPHQFAGDWSQAKSAARPCSLAGEHRQEEGL